MPIWLQKVLRLDEESVEKRRRLQETRRREREERRAAREEKRREKQQTPSSNEPSEPVDNELDPALAVSAAGGLLSGALDEDAEQDTSVEDESEQQTSDASGDGNGKDDRMLLFTKKMIEIRNILQEIDDEKNNIALPNIVVIGAQSSGKSSVLEALVGHEFLPKGTNMVTRRPIELTLVHSPETMTPYGEFPNLSLGRLTDFTKIQRTLTDLNMAVPPSEGVSDDPIRLVIHSPNIPDLSLIDLPGYIQISAQDQPTDLEKKIERLCDKYIQEPNIILSVSAADVDLANSTALKASRRVDPLGLRTIGVITKTDLVTPEQAVQILQNNLYPLNYGYVGVVAKAPRNMSWQHNRNLTDAVSRQEDRYFSSSPAFRSMSNVNTLGVRNLRKTLINVLEYSMSKSLQTTADTIRLELEESLYQLKVQYNDRKLTAQSYVAESLDVLKAGFKEFSETFGKQQVRELLRESLDNKVMDLLAERYWMDDKLEKWTTGDRSVADGYWSYKLDSSVSTLTRMGLGRFATLLVSDVLSKRVLDLAAASPFGDHPTAMQFISNSCAEILRRRYHSTSEQVENCVKPYKFEVEVDDTEWSNSRVHAQELLNHELKLCRDAYNKIKTSIGSQRLNQIIRFLEQNQVASESPESVHSAAALQQGRMAIFLRMREHLLRLRLSTIQSRTCKHKEARYSCPEIFLDVVSNKLVNTAVLFINIELLSEFYHQFPRELDSRLIHSLTPQQLSEFVNENPRIASQLRLQHKKECLELALQKINSLIMLEEQIQTEV
ncbi:GTPase Msp1 [Schizosaccharomyces japonicus yFS275]|uniref:dynamin GTPase n=1 Tax=Schizosaccharomyces japonicus (strain yFS275 / FY16936) TaxID=402676 RepID=B6K0U1_SCHJY|nr:GTPase Msp1 [Schizosaccharomyces japonicus yFS275]EEB07562.1 GTPase Msp1 [Schizosaccharomyces japonicus yFS275]